MRGALGRSRPETRWRFMVGLVLAPPEQAYASYELRPCISPILPHENWRALEVFADEKKLE